MTDAYASTEVAVEKSQGEIRRLLTSHGASSFSFAEGTHDGVIWAAVEFVSGDTRVRVQVPLKEPSAATINSKLSRTRTRTKAQIVSDLVEQEGRRIWRVLVHGLKARMISVTEGVETFEQAFLAHLVDPVTNQTLWETLREQVEAGALRSGGAGMTFGPPQLGPAPKLRSLHADDDVVDAEVVG